MNAWVDISLFKQMAHDRRILMMRAFLPIVPLLAIFLIPTVGTRNSTSGYEELSSAGETTLSTIYPDDSIPMPATRLLAAEAPVELNQQPVITATQTISEVVAVQVQVIPPIPGVHFSMDGNIFQSNFDGIAYTSVVSPGIYLLEPAFELNTHSNFAAKFKRWDAEHYEISRKLTFPGKTDLVASFELFYPVDFEFVDSAGNFVNPERISSVTIGTSHGANYQVEQPDSLILQQNRIVRRLSGLASIDIDYSINNVTVDGSNVVNQGQQRFRLVPGEKWKIQLLLYSADFTTKDAILGFPLGNQIDLRYPDGEVQSFKLDDNHHVKVAGLARGLYYVRVKDLAGVSIFIPLYITRHQTVPVIVYSYLTIGLFLGGFLLVAVILPVLARFTKKRWAASEADRISPIQDGTQAVELQDSPKAANVEEASQ